jgi:hypothetical protein
VRQGPRLHADRGAGRDDQEFAAWVEAAKKKYATNPANTFASAGGQAAQ